jgi:hypothetical protein
MVIISSLIYLLLIFYLVVPQISAQSTFYDASQGRWVAGGTLTGKVCDAQNIGLPQICIHAFSSPCGSVRLKSVTTNSDGTFVISGLMPQSYYLFADASCRISQNLINVWWNGDNGTIECNKAASVNIHKGETKSYINFTLASGSKIEGLVIDQNGDPIPDVCIAATSHCAKQWYCGAQTNMKGAFVIQGLSATVFYLQINPQCSFNNHIKKTIWWAGTHQSTSNCQKAVSISVENAQDISNAVFQITIRPALKGRVLSKTQTPIANVCVNIKERCANEWIDSAITDNHGFFFFDGIPEGKYYLQTSASCQTPQKYMDFWWNSNGGDISCKKAEAIPPNSQPYNFTLHTGNMIQGHVYNQNHQPLPNICVTAGNKCAQNNVKKAITNEKGQYQLVLTDGQYFLRTDANCDSQNYYENLWWNSLKGALDCRDAQPIQVSNNQTQKHVNFFLKTGGILTGKVLSYKQTPLSGTCIAVTHDCDQSGMVIGQTDNSGIFSTILPQGKYYVKTDYDCMIQKPNQRAAVRKQFQTQQFFLDQWWHKTQGVSLCQDADPVIIHPGKTNKDVNFVLTSGSILSGRVMNNSGLAISDILIRVYDISGQDVVKSAYTHKTGNFQLVIPSGTYIIRAMPSKHRTPNYYIDQWWNERAGSVHIQGAKKLVVTNNQHRKHILFKLQKGGAVTGMVFTPEEYPLEHIKIIASDLQKDIIWADSKTNQHGQFILSGIPEGLQRLYFDPKTGHPHFLSHWTLGATTEHQVKIVPEKIMHVPAFILPEGGAISGNIITSAKKPLAGVCVTAVKKCGDICFGQAKTDDQGKYVIKGLPSGNYYVQTNISCKDFPEDYIDMYWRKKGGTPVCRKAETIQVQKKHTTGKIDFSLSKDISFVGKIIDISGAPIENVCVVISDQCGHEWAGEAISDKQGEFVVTGISPGDYYVHTEASCYQDQPYVDQWWHSTNLVDTCESAESIKVVNSNMQVPIHFELQEKTAQVFESESHAQLIDGKYVEQVESGKVVITIHDNLLDIGVEGVALENVLKIISKYTGIKVLLFGTLKDKIYFEKKQSKLDEILLDLINGRAGHIFIYSPDRLMTSYIFSKDGQLKATSLSSNTMGESPFQLDLDKPMRVMQADDIENILNANGRVEEKIHTLGALIGYFDSENALNLLKISLDDQDEEVRMMAISVMNDLKENHLAVNDLTNSLDKDTSPAVRALAAEALGEIGDKSAIRPLMEALNDRDAGVRDTVRRAIQNIQGR